MVARSICSYCLPSSSLLYALEAVAFPSGHGRQRPEHGRGDSSSRRVARTAAAASTQLARELWRPHADGGCSDDDERGARTTAAGPRVLAARAWLARLGDCASARRQMLRQAAWLFQSLFHVEICICCLEDKLTCIVILALRARNGLVWSNGQINHARWIVTKPVTCAEIEKTFTSMILNSSCSGCYSIRNSGICLLPTTAMT